MTNSKLVDRAIRIVQIATGASTEEVKKALDESGSCKVAIVMLLAGVDVEEAQRRLKEADGFVRKAIAMK